MEAARRVKRSTGEADAFDAAKDELSKAAELQTGRALLNIRNAYVLLRLCRLKAPAEGGAAGAKDEMIKKTIRVCYLRMAADKLEECEKLVISPSDASFFEEVRQLLSDTKVSGRRTHDRVCRVPHSCLADFDLGGCGRARAFAVSTVEVGRRHPCSTRRKCGRAARGLLRT